ncbi:Aspartic peptidase, putative yapsin [Teratosphaeria destructans]|uniref:Aspartic peptidase, putative yapsin n=1 Tax=Teratosphaeria destructans TaxID=418781 RepID=A0A9W7SXJ9_9PEZI|nr:Aspartic peptidase, putative yapsin [Teratosphaeria destructans]
MVNTASQLAAAGFLLVNVASLATAEPRVVSMPIARSSQPRLAKRASTASPVRIGNNATGGFYYISALVGTPGQNISFQLDTGSSDVWMFNQDAYNSCNQQGLGCIGGYFTPSKSSTYQSNGTGGFSIEYEDQTGVTGSYFTDGIQLSNALKLTSQTMALATTDSGINIGIMGVGYDTDESIVGENGTSPYPSIIDQMVNEGLINTRAYSLYLDDLEASTGTILFGGYDTSKYSGNLTALPIQTDSQTETVDSFSVVWSLLGVTDSSGTTAIGGSALPVAAVLDSGTTLTVVPKGIFTELAQYFGASYSRSAGGYFVPCNLGSGSLNYQFGGSSGPVINVEFSELAIPVDGSNGNPLTFENGETACEFGLQPAESNGVYLLGDTFLRSAYVVYDLDANTIYMAPIKFNSTSSNIQEIQSGSTGISGVSTATGATAIQTGSTAAFGSASASGRAGTAGSLGAASSATGSRTVSGVRTTLAGATYTSAAAAASGSGASSSKSAAPAVGHSADVTAFFAVAGTLALLVGGAAIML